MILKLQLDFWAQKKRECVGVYKCVRDFLPNLVSIKTKDSSQFPKIRQNLHAESRS